MTTETNLDGEWEVKQTGKCIVKTLTKPSQAFLDKQALNEKPSDIVDKTDLLRQELIDKGLL